MLRVRVTKDFVNSFATIKSYFKGRYDSETLKSKLDVDPNFRALVDNLDQLVRSITTHFQTRKVIKQAHPSFARQYDEFSKLWSQILPDYLSWKLKDVDLDIDALIAEVVSDESSDDLESDYFDDESESAATLVTGMVDYIRENFDSGPVFNRMAEAFDWFQERGLDLELFEQRWKKSPNIIVPEHVSDLHAIPVGKGLGDKQRREGLYWLLDEAMRAYWFGADAAAICLCRALTEELIENHYLTADDLLRIRGELRNKQRYSKTPITAMMKEAEQRYSWLKNLTLIDKIEVANKVIHESKLEISRLNQWASSDNFLRLWFSAIKKMIETAPTKR